MAPSPQPDLLLVLNPRRIDECLRSFQELHMDKLWIRNMTEEQIAGVFPDILEMAEGYGRLIIASDDAVTRQPALDAVVKLLDEGHPVVTGYSTLDSRDWRVNLIKEPLFDAGGDLFNPTGHKFYDLAEVLCWPDRAVPTFLCGFTLTGMSYEMWVKYPLMFEWGFDTNLSRRLVRDDVPLVAAREGFCWHVKETWNHQDREPRKRLLIGEEPAGLVLERV